jgi:predicted NUDIX family NTP pyrophosphohydrolase
MKTHTKGFQTFLAAMRAAVIAVLLIGPLAGFAAAQDDGARKMGGAGFVLYVSLMRG